jgi:hypothetical protein
MRSNAVVSCASSWYGAWNPDYLSFHLKASAERGPKVRPFSIVLVFGNHKYKKTLVHSLRANRRRGNAFGSVMFFALEHC